MGPKNGPKSGHFWDHFWDQFLVFFGFHFGVQNLPKMSQHGIQKPSPRAMIATRNDFENCCFVLFFTVNLEHQASQESSKTAKKPPKKPPNGLQEPFQKKGPIFDSVLTRKVTPNWAQKRLQKGFKNWNCIWRTIMVFMVCF